MDIYGAGEIQNPVVVDLEVKDKKVTGVSVSQDQNKENLKQEAVVDVLKMTNDDVLVEPRFETEGKSGQFTTRVTGFPATYINFRPIKAEDVPLLQVGVTQKAEVMETRKDEQKKGSVAKQC